MDSIKKNLLLVDDDDRYRERLAQAMARRGFQVTTAHETEAARAALKEFAPDAVVLDLKMPGESGLTLVPELVERFPNIRIIILTGFGSIATAMQAVRLGACDYLSKPADADQITAAIFGQTATASENVETPSLGRVEWEHLQRVLSDCDNNISQTARILGIDRRSLQRKLAKFPPQN